MQILTSNLSPQLERRTTLPERTRGPSTGAATGGQAQGQGQTDHQGQVLGEGGSLGLIRFKSPTFLKDVFQSSLRHLDIFYFRCG